MKHRISTSHFTNNVKGSDQEMPKMSELVPIANLTVYAETEKNT